MPEGFEVALYSLLTITVSGVFSIALARLSHVHPAYFFLGSGLLAALLLPFALPSSALLVQLAQIGGLFVIFLSALEIEWDLRFTWKLRTLISGISVQIVTGAAVAAVFVWFLKTDLLSAIAAGLLASMHTPERKASVVNSETFRNSRVSNDVALTGLISEIAALVGMSLIIAYSQQTVMSGDLLHVAVGAMLIVLILVSFIPQVLRFLMRRVGEESYALYYAMLALLLMVTLVVRRSGLEPLLGAYAAGFFLTRFISTGSKVLERLRFTGHSVIVPAFYLVIGMSSDLFSALTSPVLSGAGAMLVVTLIAAAFFRYLIMPGAGTLQAFRLLRKNPLILVLIYIAHARGIITATTLHTLLVYAVLNEIIVVVLSRLTGGAQDAEPIASAPPRVLVPLSNPETMLPLLHLATHLGNDGGAVRIYPLNVVPDQPGAEDRIRSVENQFNELIPLFEVRNQQIELMARIANDRISAVSHAARELLADRILLGLGVIPTLQRPQGYSFLEGLTQTIPDKPVIAAHIQADLSLTNAINVIIANERLLASCDEWLPTVLILARRLKADPVFYAESAQLAEVRQKLTELSFRHRFELRAGQIHAGLDLLTLDNNENALSVAILERAAFYPQEKIHARLPEMMLRAFGDRNFILLYPSGVLPVKRGAGKTRTWQRIKNFLGFK